MWTDLRIALRTYRKAPALPLTIIVVLAVAIGANTAIFSIVNSVLLHPPGIRNPSRVVAVRVHYYKLNMSNVVMSAPDFADARNSRQIFSSAASMQESDYGYTGQNWPERFQGADVTWEWFRVFGARPLLGRLFTPEEDQPNANHVAVLAYATWKKKFGGDPAIVGSTVLFNRLPYRIIGVMPPDFRWPSDADLWAPMGLPPSAYANDNRFSENLTTVARLAPGVTFNRAQTYMGLLSERALQTSPYGNFGRDARWGMFIMPFTDFTFGDVRTPLLMLLVAVGVVLLIACSNIAAMLLARTLARSREMAVRLALGASRVQLVRQALAETGLLAAAGMLIGLGVAYDGLGGARWLAPQDFADLLQARLDWRVLAFTVAAAAVATILSAMVPALHAGQLDPNRSLTKGTRSNTGAIERSRMRTALIVGELCLTFVLLVGTGLLLKSIGRLRQVSVGFTPQGITTAAASLPPTQYKTDAQLVTFWREVVQRIESQPGIQTAAIAYPIPFIGAQQAGSFEIEGHPAAPGSPGPHGDNGYVSPGYLKALRIPLLEGRFFGEQDQQGSEPVVVIDETLAKQYWPGQDPVGQHIRRGSRDRWATVIGVVGHTKRNNLGSDSGKGVYYYSVFQQPGPTMFILARGSTTAAARASAIRDAVASIDAAQPVYDVKTMRERVAASLAPRVFVVELLALFGGIALALAIFGLYGVLAYAVAQRSHEIGIRMALGATRDRVLNSVLFSSLRMALWGLIAGIVLATLAGRMISSELYRVSAFDPTIMIAACFALVAIALLAGLVPAWRAMRIDPASALRIE
jgi:predicted permease